MTQPSPWAPDRTAAKAARNAWIRALEALARIEANPDLTLVSMLGDLAATHGSRPALLGEAETLSYTDLAATVNQVARWALAQGFARGDVVALLLPNRPLYPAIWLGLARAGCVTALLNTHLAEGALRHSLAAAGAKGLIVGDAHPSLTDLPIWHVNDMALTAQNAAQLDPATHPLPEPTDRALLIYTSGTTGLPKAANVTHARVLEWSLWFAAMMDARPEDRLYDCLPMYHSTGGIVAIGAMLTSGGSVLIRTRFSASRFWDDVADHNCTIFQYIGELCRYLTQSPSHPKERAHNLRLAVGNGMQGDVWPVLQERFALPRVLEFYAATEGSVSLYNVEGRPGAIGRIPAFLAHRFPVALIRCDPDTGEIARNADGLCIPCDIDEPGEAIGPVHGARRFDGYTDAAASERKLLRDVFAPGDRWFRTGDLMRRDADGFYFFLDRLGDTFRWKGENVATTEVAQVLRSGPGVADAVVFGVAVPGHEGRAGMAAITTTQNFDLAALHAHLAAQLPHYAQPLFLRLCARLDVTGTFKLVKSKLSAEGYAASPDPIWLNDRLAGRFVPLDLAVLPTLRL